MVNSLSPAVLPRLNSLHRINIARTGSLRMRHDWGALTAEHLPVGATGRRFKPAKQAKVLPSFAPDIDSDRHHASCATSLTGNPPIRVRSNAGKPPQMHLCDMVLYY